LGALWKTNDSNQFRLSIQTGFRGAVGVHFAGGFVQDGFLAESNFDELNEISLTEADFDFNGIAADDDRTLSQVQPEELENIEFAWQAHPVKDHEFQLVLFHNNLQNIISAQAHGYESLVFGDLIGEDQIGTWNGNWYYQNKSGQIKQWGAEIDYKLYIKTIQFQMSHAYINNYNVDDSIKGIYVLDNNHSAAYPENVSRFHISYNKLQDWLISYHHLYYWNYFSVTGKKMDGDHLASLSLSYQKNKNSRLRLSLDIKNLWDSDGLYPINGTGNISAGDGTPAIEGRTWWLNARYVF